MSHVGGLPWKYHYECHQILLRHFKRSYNEQGGRAFVNENSLDMALNFRSRVYSVTDFGNASIGWEILPCMADHSLAPGFGVEVYSLTFHNTKNTI